MLSVLVTGGAGFIGSHVVDALAARGDRVVVLDAFEPYYDPSRKRHNLAEVQAAHPDAVSVLEGDIRDPETCARAVQDVDAVIHLAARPGVRASLDDPTTTFAINLTGTLNLLEAIRQANVQRVVLASSSSVYGGDATAPFREDAPASRPLSPYAASKRACELLGASYAELFGMGVIALRFFTVYGPRGRPDMAIGKFLRLALQGRPLPLYGDGSVRRDFTYVDDIARGVLAALDLALPGSGYEVLNIGGGNLHTMKELIDAIARTVDTDVQIETHPPAAGDMPLTHADLTRARARLGFTAQVSLADGLARAAAWERQRLEREAASP